MPSRMTLVTLRPMTAVTPLADRGIWPGRMHVFQALPKLVPEAELAIGRAAAFVRTDLETP